MNPVKRFRGSISTEFPLICVLRNERDILPAFLDYYRSIGVTCFHFVDSGSSDGSREYIVQQEDSQLYCFSGGYRKTNAGLDWVNRVGRLHCNGKWTTVVDADEFLQLPGSGKFSSLQEITGYMRKELSLGLYSVLIDFFGDDLASPSTRVANLDSLMRSSPNHVPYSNYVKSVRQSFPFFDIRSKARGDIAGENNYRIRSYKIPLVFWHFGFMFTRSTHVCTPIPLSNECGYVYHFKFRPGFSQRLSLDRKEADRLNQDVYRVSERILKNQYNIKKHTNDCRDSPSIQGAEVMWGLDFKDDWSTNNKTRSHYFNIITQNGNCSDCFFEEKLNNLIDSPSWRCTKPIRRYLYERGLLRHDHYPERVKSSLPVADQTIAIYESFWWSITSVLRFPSLVKNALNWFNLGAFSGPRGERQ